MRKLESRSASDAFPTGRAVSAASPPLHQPDASRRDRADGLDTRDLSGAMAGSSLLRGLILVVTEQDAYHERNGLERLRPHALAVLAGQDLEVTVRSPSVDGHGLLGG